MKAIYLDSFKLHDTSDSAAKFFIESPIEGLEFPAVRLNSFNRAGEDGVYISNAFLGERRVTLSGRIFNVSSESDLVTQRRLLLAACAPIKDSSGILQKRTLRFTAMDGADYRIQGQVVKVTAANDNIRHSRFLIDFLADSQAIEAYSASTASVSPYIGGGVTVPFTVPFTLGSGSGGSATVTIAGDAPVLPVITLSGPLTNPRIENATTGRHMQLTLTIGSGESVVIDMANKTIVQGGVTNRYGTKTDTSSFWWLATGANTVRLTTGSTGDTGSASLSYREAYFGI